MKQYGSPSTTTRPWTAISAARWPLGHDLAGRAVAGRMGPVDVADMTFSVAKSYLAICAGLAVDDGLISGIDDPVDDGTFDANQNRTITWCHLLRQTSEWEGTLGGKADRIDRNRQLDVPPNTPLLKGIHRDLQAPGTFWEYPGTFWEYNDIRVNVPSYALMQVFRWPLPEVPKERIMDPVGASDDWAWHGYENSWIEIDGRRMQSVSGGAHWGGGMFISTRDHARIRLLMANRGLWADRQLLSPDWIDACTTPCDLNSNHGLLWWLNGDGAHCLPAPIWIWLPWCVGLTPAGWTVLPNASCAA